MLVLSKLIYIFTHCCWEFKLVHVLWKTMSLSCKVEHATCNFRSGYREIYTLVPGDNVFENSHTIIVCIISKLDTIQCL